MEKYDARIDAYIEKSADFAKPILKHIRQLIHETSPLITESVKWGMPFFEYKGPISHMAAFKQHAAFGFWKAQRLKDTHGVLNVSEEAAAGSFGRLTSLADLPDDKILKDFILQMIDINEKGIKEAPKKAPAEKTVLVVPDDFAKLLNDNEAAKETFEKFSYSNKKEYLEWIIEAKTDATRQKRMQTSIEWLSEGKSRMWKYK
jgi:uncharacterized protein YdeI (YjbR/CyaY-like superfamily)